MKISFFTSKRAIYASPCPTGVLYLIAFTVIFLCSCADKCDKVDCLNGATCNDGTCYCAAGYEGDNCETEVRTKFLGTYNVTDSCTLSGPRLYTVNIAISDSDLLSVKIAYFNNEFANSVIARVDGYDITIGTQYPDFDSRQVKGSGTVHNNIMTWSYTVKDTLSGVTNSCNPSRWVK